MATAVCYGQHHGRLAQRRDVIFARRSKPANQKYLHYSWTYVRTPRTENFRSVGESVIGLATDVPEVCTKLLEASWKHHEDVSRRGFSEGLWLEMLVVGDEGVIMTQPTARDPDSFPACVFCFFLFLFFTKWKSACKH